MSSEFSKRYPLPFNPLGKRLNDIIDKLEATKVSTYKSENAFRYSYMMVWRSIIKGGGGGGGVEKKVIF